MSDEESGGPLLWFRPQMVNVTKLTRPTDCDILIEECLHSIRGIEGQLSDPDFDGDKDWRRDALRAQDTLLHKIKLLEMKKADLIAVQSHRRSPEERFGANFLKAAHQMLPPDVFTELYQEAGGGTREA